jgi:hypothetical protein
MSTDCHPAYCGCEGEQTFESCLGPNEAATCPPYSCPRVPGSCAGLDQAACGIQPGCTSLQCPDCKGGQVFEGCEPSDQQIGCGPCPTPPSCSGLDEASCKGRSDCQPQYCAVCASAPTFAGCAAHGAPPAECPAEACVTAGPCDTLDEASCKTRSDCKPEYCPDCDGGQRFGLCAGPNEAVACLGCPAPTSCAGLDEAACVARADCQAVQCPACDGGVQFAGCAAPDGGEACPATDCKPPCAGLDEASCMARPDCETQQCDCDGGRAFEGCTASGQPATNCFTACDVGPLWTFCDGFQTIADCQAQPNCHATLYFQNPELSFCSGACPPVLFHCSPGAKAPCSGGNPLAGCGWAPYCPSGYVVAYDIYGCSEGCVTPTECAP